MSDSADNVAKLLVQNFDLIIVELLNEKDRRQAKAIFAAVKVFTKVYLEKIEDEVFGDR